WRAARARRARLLQRIDSPQLLDRDARLRDRARGHDPRQLAHRAMDGHRDRARRDDSALPDRLLPVLEAALAVGRSHHATGLAGGARVAPLDRRAMVDRATCTERFAQTPRLSVYSSASVRSCQSAG